MFLGRRLLSGPVGETLSGRLSRTQAELASARRIRREVHASGRTRALLPAPDGLAREAQLLRPADQPRLEAEIDRAGARPGGHGLADRAWKPVGAVAQHLADHRVALGGRRGADEV